MTEPAQKSDRMKMLLIPVLGLVLLFALMGGDEETSAPSVQLINSPAESAVENRTSANDPPSDFLSDWPRKSLASIIAHNPFELKDPRAQLDIAFSQAGLTGDAVMTAITAKEFFPAPQLSVDEQDAVLQQMFAFLAPHHAAAEDERSNPDPDTEKAIRANPVMETSVESPVAVSQDEMPEPQSGHQRRLQLQQRLMTLRSEPVRMFMKTRHGNSALLGSRKVTQGELLEDGIRIAAIDREGITFEIVETSSVNQDTPADSEEQGVK